MEYDFRLLMAVNRLPGNNGWLKRRIYDSCRDSGDFAEGLKTFACLRSPRSRSRVPATEELFKLADEDLRRTALFGIEYRILGDADYPVSLSLISDPPLVLYVRGSFSNGENPPVAIVGTRRPSMPAIRQAFSLGLEFAGAGYPVVSGLAYGIDRAAHDGALASDGVTWAVLAGGLDKPGPMAHRRLASQILEKGGALLGEVAPGGFPAKYAFPRRNRILSGLSRGCIVVQAPTRSGALITADFALDQNRDLFVASSGLTGVASEGTRTLESQGAPVINSAADVLGDWGRFLDIRKVCVPATPESGSDLARMMDMELNGRIFRYMGGWFEYRGA